LESVTNLVFVYLSYLKIIPNYVTSEKSKWSTSKFMLQVCSGFVLY
jgi:hypothetical protein